MDWMPETEAGDEDRNAENGERENENGKGRSRAYAYVMTFLLGALFSIVLMYSFRIVLKRSQMEPLRQHSDQDGAKVLTDSKTLAKLNEIESIIEQNYYGEVDSDMLSTYLFKGAAAGLNDDYAAYYTAEELRSVLDSGMGEYYGIGAVLSLDRQTGEIRAVHVYEGSPAEQGGLLAEDQFLELDGERLEGYDLTELVSMIKSKESAFTVTVYRPSSDETLELTLTCGEVEVEYVTYEMKEDGIGYIRITEFTQSAVTQFRDALDALSEQGMKKLIVDLRNNPGGLLDSVCDILREILPKGLIVYTEDRDGNREEYSANGKRSVDCTVAVLINGHSASASEIFAGAVQDYGLGPLIGTATYGKGIVQKTYKLNDGSGFKLTVEKYFTPKGQDIHGNGITPDIIVEETEADGSQENMAGESTDSVGQENTAGESTDSAVQENTTGESTDSAVQGNASEDPVLARALEELRR